MAPVTSCPPGTWDLLSNLFNHANVAVWYGARDRPSCRAEGVQAEVGALRNAAGSPENASGTEQRHGDEDDEEDEEDKDGVLVVALDRLMYQPL